MKRVSSRPRAATIYDVARAAGVSPATVSRVVNGTARVRQAARTRVEEAIQRADFHPYDLAAGRARRAMGMVGLVIPDVTNPFWAEVALGAEQTLRPFGYGLLLANTGDSVAREEEAIAMLRRKRADGVLIAAMHDVSPSLHRMQRAGAPVILLGHGADDGTFDLVTADGTRGAYLATRHLLQLQHRRIGFIGGPSDERTAQARRRGYEHALQEAGIPAPATWIAEGNGWGHEAGTQRMRELLARRQALTAVAAANDVLALGALHALDDAGLRVPEDVSLTGFDDLALATLCRPSLTTVSQPRAERGRIAATLLLHRLGHAPAEAVSNVIGAVGSSGGTGPSSGSGTDREAPQRIILEPHLVVRRSTRTLDGTGAGRKMAG